MAPRTLNRLTDLAVRKAREPGWYADGGGLYLRIGTDGFKRWVLVIHLAGKRSEMGLGSPSEVSLAEARSERDKARKLIREGVNPITARKANRAAMAARNLTFSAWAREVAPALAPKQEKAHAAWLRMMTEWVGALKTTPVGEVTTEDVIAALKPYWSSRPETARRMRMRIEAVLDAARAGGKAPADSPNPARWKGHLQHLLPRQEIKVRHHPALPYADAPAFMADLGKRDAMAAYALGFAILTAARTSEVINATWSEIDLEAKIWTVPAGRMKAGRAHRVPLSKAALDILAKAKNPASAKATGWVFPSLFRRGKPLSTGAMDRTIDDMGYQGVITVHGFRSTFRDYAGDRTEFAKETIEAALAHVVGDETERAYRRGDALAKRRDLMDAWATYLMQPAKPDQDGEPAPPPE